MTGLIHRLPIYTCLSEGRGLSPNNPPEWSPSMTIRPMIPPEREPSNTTWTRLVLTNMPFVVAKSRYKHLGKIEQSPSRCSRRLGWRVRLIGSKRWVDRSSRSEATSIRSARSAFVFAKESQLAMLDPFEPPRSLHRGLKENIDQRNISTSYTRQGGRTSTRRPDLSGRRVYS